MALPSTITVNIGNPAADVVFTKAAPSGGEVYYTAPSPQGDLEGRPTIRVAHETTKSRFVRTLHKGVWPEYDSTSGEYVGNITVATTIIRRAACPTALVDKAVEANHETLAQASVKAALVAAEL